MNVRRASVGSFVASIASALVVADASADVCAGRTVVSADVVALDQVMWINRLGTMRPDGMIYALRSDVIQVGRPDPKSSDTTPQLRAGEVMLRSERRPRPIVLRARELAVQGYCVRAQLDQPHDRDRHPGR
jgi:hypothetical protein